MSTPTQTPTPRPPAYEPTRHGTLSQIIAVFVALLLGVINICLLVSWKHQEQDAKTADEHTNTLIEAKLTPAVKAITDSIAVLRDKVAQLDKDVGEAQGELKRMKARAKDRDQEQGELRAQIQDPVLILGTIRKEIQTAQANKTALPEPQLVLYRKALFDFQPGVPEYWTTLAAIVNYQSWLNQKNAVAPDPAKISRPCKVLTGGHDNIIMGEYRDCIVDLDTQSFVGATFIDSVIRYRGGSTSLVNVRFINCYFILDLPSSSAPNNLLFALLISTNQTNVTVN
jgi:hypothetical protein